MKIIIIVLLCIMIFITGCSTFAYTNKEIDAKQPRLPDNRAQFAIERDRGKDGSLFVLALSGGGSRAAYFSAEVMLALQDLQGKNGNSLLQSVDAISSVSGGALPAAYYSISKDLDDNTATVPSGRVWDRNTVNEVMSRNYIARWIGNWFWPDNIALYWATAYDRSDIMAQTFADNMFDKKHSGWDLRFKDINEERPYLIINSTSGTSGNFGKSFTFTDDDFRKIIKSDISQYEISRAVMASASFPAVFNYMTLFNYNYHDKTKGKKYFHVFDGGNVDNFGLDSVRRIIGMRENNKYKKIVILLVDAFTKPQGIATNEYDARSGINYAVDFNFMDSTDILLQKVRDDSLAATQRLVEELEDQGKEAIFYHLSFDETKHFKNEMAITGEYSAEEDSIIMVKRSLNDVLNQISTSFNIADEHKEAISKAVKLLVTPENKCIQEIQLLIRGEMFHKNNPYCIWPTDDMNVARN
ncbi:MAG: patatin-like phospholipase family protein [Gammaproteobacteria bacterium]|nr:patatin-like phospholipase family protein [Gammaproteobacteria bacterium]